MYSLLVSNLIEENLGSAIDIDHGRFLEYTSDSIRNQLENLSAEATECLKAWPCLIMQEGRGEEVVHLAQIKTIQLDGREIKLTHSTVSGQATLVNDTLWKLRGELDIAEFEFSRNHWAVKDRSGPIRLHSSPRFLSEVSAATYAASLPVGSITA